MTPPLNSVRESSHEGKRGRIDAEIGFDKKNGPIVREYADVIEALGGKVESDRIAYGIYNGYPSYEKAAFRDFMHKLMLTLPEGVIEHVEVMFNITTQKNPAMEKRFNDYRIQQGVPTKTESDAQLDAFFNEQGGWSNSPTMIKRMMSNGLRTEYGIGDSEPDAQENTLFAGCSWRAEDDRSPLTEQKIAQMTHVVEKLRERGIAMIDGTGEAPAVQKF